MVSIELDPSILSDFGWQYIEDGAIATGLLIEVHGSADQVPRQATLAVARIIGSPDQDQDLVMVQLEEDLCPDYTSDGEVEVIVNVDEEVRCIFKAIRLRNAHVPVFDASRHLLSMLKVAKQLDVFMNVNGGMAMAARFKFPRVLAWDEVRYAD